MSHRSIAWMCVLVTALCTGCLFAADKAQEARQAAAHRQRRVIFNNDGDDALHYGMFLKAPASKEGLLSIRMDHISDCGVDTVFYCTTQSFNSFTHDSQVTEVFTTTEGAFGNNRTAELIKMGADPLAVAVEACRKRNIEVFYTIRMNDIHDNFWYEMQSQWKKDNRDKLLGKPEDKQKYPASDSRHVWTWADFAQQEVRDMTVAAIKDVVDRYDVDGIDLDFLRHPAYFKETLVHKPATRPHLNMLTDMVAQIRQAILAASERKDKPILLSVRVLPTLALNRRFGFDVERWVTEGHVDLVAVGGGYDPFTMPLKDMVDRGHEWGIPVYGCLSSSGMRQQGVKDTGIGGTMECWRAVAANAWLAGVDGIMTFNLFPKLPDTDQTKRVRQIWSDMSDPRKLVGKDKLYCIENIANLWNTSFMVRTVPIADRLPIDVKKGSTVTRVLPIADDIPALADRIDTLHLRVCLAGLAEGDKVQVKMNGADLSPAAEKPNWLAGDVPASVMKEGANRVAVTFNDGKAAALTITSVELAVKYKR